ncbi:MAG: TetR/AcrR family transcriptional regulator [Gemmatimonadota bacterium]
MKRRTAPRWRRRPDDRPDEILAAALEVFVEQGLAGARVDEIAQRAGISKGTLYLYFSGKEELFKEAIRARARATLEALETVSGGGDPWNRLSRFVDAYWARLRRPAFAGLYRLVLAELHQFPELTRFWADEVSGRVIERIAPLLREGIQAGVFRDIDPEVSGRMIVGLLAQHAVWASRPELFPHVSGRSDTELVREIKDFLSAALASSGEASRMVEAER